MKKSNKEKELEIFCYFGGKGLKPSDFTEEEKKEYYDWSERGIGSNIKNINRIGVAKRWTGVMMEQYENGVLDCSMPYMVLLGAFDNKKKWWQFWKSPHKPPPRDCVDFLKKEMFKGIDAEIIEDCYQSLL